jgi:hypothetical protein
MIDDDTLDDLNRSAGLSVTLTTQKTIPYLPQIVSELVTTGNLQLSNIERLFEKYGIPKETSIEVLLNEDSLRIIETLLKFKIMYSSIRAAEIITAAMFDIMSDPDTRRQSAKDVLRLAVEMSKRSGKIEEELNIFEKQALNR